MSFVPGYEAGQNCQLLNLSSLLLLKEGEGEEIKISVVLYLAMRLVKLPATEPLFILVVEEKDETCDPSDRWELLTDTRTF